ncbi:MAG: ral secretion pathway protein GspH [Enterobacter mori]|nr:ral secretion pathway protein GspH [Enterobacter mori]
MKHQRGFTLLEIILALVIFASCAMMVVSTIPSRSGADIFGQQRAPLGAVNRGPYYHQRRFP